MNLIYFVIAIVVLVWLLIKAWVFLVNSIFDPMIAKAEQKELRDSIPDPPAPEHPNMFVRKHFRILEDKRKVREYQLGIAEERQRFREAYQEYLEWCRETNTPPVALPPSERDINVYHLD